jgi:hypothetical protein
MVLRFICVEWEGVIHGRLHEDMDRWKRGKTDGERKFTCTFDEPVVDLAAGRLRGFQLDSTYVFRGITYAEAKRWEMPTPVAPWEGVKDALNYGYVCPLMADEKPSAGEMACPHRYWPASEDCLNLNVWTNHWIVPRKSRSWSGYMAWGCGRFQH